jgi:hypothetical protein
LTLTAATGASSQTRLTVRSVIPRGRRTARRSRTSPSGRGRYETRSGRSAQTAPTRASSAAPATTRSSRPGHPDSRHIAFSSSSRDDNTRIWIVDLDDRNLRSLSRGDIDIAPHWTSRGDILFIRGYRVIAVDPDTGTETPLPLSALDVSSSPKGDWLTLGEGTGIVLTTRDDEGRRVLIKRRGLIYSAPAWRPA